MCFVCSKYPFFLSWEEQPLLFTEGSQYTAEVVPPQCLNASSYDYLINLYPHTYTKAWPPFPIEALTPSQPDPSPRVFTYRHIPALAFPLPAPCLPVVRH